MVLEEHDKNILVNDIIKNRLGMMINLAGQRAQNNNKEKTFEEELSEIFLTIKDWNRDNFDTEITRCRNELTLDLNDEEFFTYLHHVFMLMADKFYDNIELFSTEGKEKEALKRNKKEIFKMINDAVDKIEPEYLQYSETEYRSDTSGGSKKSKLSSRSRNSKRSIRSKQSSQAVHNIENIADILLNQSIGGSTQASTVKNDNDYIYLNGGNGESKSDEEEKRSNKSMDGGKSTKSMKVLKSVNEPNPYPTEQIEDYLRFKQFMKAKESVNVDDFKEQVQEILNAIEESKKSRTPRRKASKSSIRKRREKKRGSASGGSSRSTSSNDDEIELIKFDAPIVI